MKVETSAGFFHGGCFAAWAAAGEGSLLVTPSFPLHPNMFLAL